jgi:hypothetical protein
MQGSQSVQFKVGGGKTSNVLYGSNQFLVGFPLRIFQTKQ